MSFARTTASIVLFAAGCATFAGCATAPSTRAERQSLRESAEATLGEMIARDPAIHDVTRWAPAYAVFPAIGKGGVLIGGAYGRGILYEAGVATGYVSLEQASLGAQLGGQSFSELLVLRTADDVDALKAGRYTVGPTPAWWCWAPRRRPTRPSRRMRACSCFRVEVSWSMSRSTDNSSSISRSVHDNPRWTRIHGSFLASSQRGGEPCQPLPGSSSSWSRCSCSVAAAITSPVADRAHRYASRPRTRTYEYA